MPSETNWRALINDLSSGAELVLPTDETFDEAAKTWSELKHDKPAAVVKVVTEADILAAVKFGISQDIPFRARGGGHSLFSSIKSPGFVIDMRLHNKITVNTETNTMTVEAGAINKDLFRVLAEAKMCTPTASANGVGVIGSLLGGGNAADSGLRGLMIDNLISARVISGENGNLHVASEEKNPDLFWGLRGAGFSFGIVTEVVLKIYPFADSSSPRTDGKVWTGWFLYDPAKIPEVHTHVWASRRDDACFSYLCASAPPDFVNTPAFMVALFFFGTDEDMVPIKASLEKFAPLYSEMNLVPYEHVNDGVDPWCEEEGRKAFFGAGLEYLHPDALAAIWSSYSEFWNSSRDFKKSVFMIDMPGKGAVENMAKDSTSYAHRHINVWANPVPWYSEKANDVQAHAWGGKVREILRTVPEKTNVIYYINNATGDEDISGLYGDAANLDRLRNLKQKWDPRGLYGFENFARADGTGK